MQFTWFSRSFLEILIECRSHEKVSNKKWLHDCDLLFAKAKNVAFPAQCKQETTVAHIVIISHEQCQVENFQRQVTRNSMS